MGPDRPALASPGPGKSRFQRLSGLDAARRLLGLCPANVRIRCYAASINRGELVRRVISAPPPKGGSCYPFTAVQPAIADVDSALLQAGLGGPAPDAQLAAPAERVGPTGSETVQPAYIPPTVLRGLGWVESSVAPELLYATQRGQSGPTLTAGSCAYGIMQIATGMAIAGNPTAVQQEIGSDFHSNIAAATQLITKYWNRDPSVMPYMGRHDPHIVEDWYFAVWAFNCYGADCTGYGVHNDPDDPALPWPRPVYNSHDRTVELHESGLQ